MSVLALTRARLFFLALALLAFFVGRPACAAGHASASAVNGNTQFVYDMYRMSGFCFPHVSPEEFGAAAATGQFPFVRISGQKQNGDVLVFDKYMAIYAGQDTQGHELMTIFYDNKKHVNMRISAFAHPLVGVYRYQIPNNPNAASPCQRFGNTVWKDGRVVRMAPAQ